MYSWISVFIVIFCLLPNTHNVYASYCAYYYDDNVKDFQVFEQEDFFEEGIILSDNKTIKCTEDKSCFTYWNNDQLDPDMEAVVLLQGCWTFSGEMCLNQICQNVKEPFYLTNKTHSLCCCTGDMCNFNFTEAYVAPNMTEASTLSPNRNQTSNTSEDQKPLILIICCIILFLVLALISFCFVYKYFLRREKQESQDQILDKSKPRTPSFDLDNLKLMHIIGSGRYGHVWKGNLDNMTVAVKVFQPQFRQYYINELDLYSEPLMEHDNIIRFIGGEEWLEPESGHKEYLLVLAYIQHGSLISYLKNNAYNWTTMCKLASSVSKGLSYLHAEFEENGQRKYPVVHRDFNSRNILVRDDKTCVICDLGFALKVSGSKVVGEEDNDIPSVTDVGTFRYMAPEVLEGAVNLRDCEASLKQVDVYALGLVLWEIARRCQDLYPGSDVPDYELPFQEEIGIHPLFEDMQIVVAREKRRPCFPAKWPEDNQAVNLLKETIEDCWDQDAEARLTAMCVAQRIKELELLWNHHKARNPNFNPTLTLESEKTQVVHYDVCTGELITKMEPRYLQTPIPRSTEMANIPLAVAAMDRSYDLDDEMVTANTENNALLDPQIPLSSWSQPQISDPALQSNLLLSPTTVSTSLSTSSAADLLVDFAPASQPVDPKNLHHSDENFHCVTTDLKYSNNSNNCSVNMSATATLNESIPSEHNITDTRLNLPRDLITDNLSYLHNHHKQHNLNFTMPAPLLVPTPSPALPSSWGQLTVDQARAKLEGNKSGIGGNGFSDFSSMPALYEEDLCDRDLLCPLANAKSTGDLSFNQKRPTTLELKPKSKKKVFAVYMPNDKNKKRNVSSSNRRTVQTGVAKMDDNTQWKYLEGKRPVVLRQQNGRLPLVESLNEHLVIVKK